MARTVLRGLRRGNAPELPDYDRPLAARGLTWRDVTAWWADREKLTGQPERAIWNGLYRRLLGSIEAPLPVPWVVLLGQLSNALRDLRCGAARVAGSAVVLSAARRAPADGGNGALLQPDMVRWERPLSRPCGPCGVAFGQPGQRPFPARNWQL